MVAAAPTDTPTLNRLRRAPSQLAAVLEGRQADELRNALVQFERHLRSLQESVMRVRMLPIASIFNRFPRMIRDLGQRLFLRDELNIGDGLPFVPCRLRPNYLRAGQQRRG